MKVCRLCLQSGHNRTSCPTVIGERLAAMSPQNRYYHRCQESGLCGRCKEPWSPTVDDSHASCPECRRVGRLKHQAVKERRSA